MKKNLHYFDKDLLIDELVTMTEWLDEQEILSEIALDYRVKSLDSILLKYDRYRGVHVYYQKSGRHYPIEIQFNTLFDRQMNNWLHDYLYKKNYPIETGRVMREKYECGLIRNEHEFKEVLNNVLSGSERS